MPTIRQRRVSTYPPVQAQEPADERVYTEEDYAVHPFQQETTAEDNADDAFLPDAEELPWEYPSADDFPASDGDADYSRLFEGVFDDSTDDEDDPLDEELLTDEELAELKRSHWQLLSSLGDFAGIILGTALILVLVTLLVSLINWLVNDMNQSFILLQKHF